MSIAVMSPDQSIPSAAGQAAGEQAPPPARAGTDGSARSRSGVAAQLRAQAFFLFAQFRGEFGAEVLGFEDLTNLDTGVLGVRIRTTLDPLDGLGQRPGLDQPETGDQLPRFGKWSVADASIGAAEMHARALRTGLQAFAGQQHAGLDQLF